MSRELDPGRDRALREALGLRAELLGKTRTFFAERGYLEVETPALADGVLVESQIDPLRVHRGSPDPGSSASPLHLHTSPEAAMKRLLARGSGPIFQIARVFRQGEAGAHHQPEFTMLEWYRPGIDHHVLMDEVSAYLGTMLGVDGSDRVSWRDLWQTRLGLDPENVTARELERIASQHGIEVPGVRAAEDPDFWLDVLFSTAIQPLLAPGRPLFVTDYPASRAAFARVVGEGASATAERFETFFRGLELANGYHELLEPAVYRDRMERANRERVERGQEPLPLDEAFLRELEASGLPACAGVALGLDRLLMLVSGVGDLRRLLPFPRSGD